MCNHHCSSHLDSEEATHLRPFNKIRPNSKTYHSEKTEKKHRSLIYRRELKKVLIDCFGVGSKYDTCMRYCSSDESGVSLVSDGDRVRWKNRLRCKDRSCVFCGQIRSIENQRKVEEILAHPELQDVSVFFCTLTSQRIVQTLDAGLKTHSAMRTKLLNSLRVSRRFPSLGCVTSVEATWRLHDSAVTPHNHLLLLFRNSDLLERNPGSSLEEILEQVSCYVKKRWLAIAEKQGVYASESGQDVQIVPFSERSKVSKYVSKFCLELTSPDTKKSRISGNYSFADLLNAYHEKPSAQLKRAIVLFVEGQAGKRTFQISHKLRAYLTPDDEDNVEEVEEVAKVPLPVFMALSEHEVADTLTDVLNGYYSYRDDLDHIEAIFMYLCSVFQSGWENRSHRRLLRDFAARLSDLKRPPHLQQEDFRYFAMT